MAATHVQGNSQTFTSVTSRVVNYSGVTAGNLLVTKIWFSSVTVSNMAVTDTQGNTWTRVTDANSIGSNPPNRSSAIWWAVAGATTGGTVTVTATWTESLSGGMQIREFSSAAVGDWSLISADSFEETSTSTAHNSAPSPGLDAEDNYVMVSVGATDGSTGGYTAGTNWTGAVLNTGGTQYRVPSSTVTGDRGAWTSGNSRTAVSSMAIFARVAAAPESEAPFQYRIIRRKGLNFGVN